MHEKNFFNTLINNNIRGVDMIKVEKKTVGNTTIPLMGT